MDTQPSNRSSSHDRVSIRVVETVAAADGIDPLDVSPPLHDVIDPSALDALFEPTQAGHRPGGTVTFAYRGHWVRVESDGRVTLVSESESDPGPETKRNSGVQPETESR
ncbi:HalOD1 output domain-containing protein [Natrinema salifodinae]|uniref:Halobacterial output domain-containing protein n=1 Tax=Natrinema salifodinae TaxID=1202768 RepID=A0A1I0PIJ2_9EURY|nr:HalOD1 output domain-containing protein [Natrinema salifodinae]SEW14210.1 hypothetical protein SAMN05216285_2608 [Natrinema salifodinae]